MTVVTSIASMGWRASAGSSNLAAPHDMARAPRGSGGIDRHDLADHHQKAASRSFAVGAVTDRRFR
jgi:hypothetical protein